MSPQTPAPGHSLPMVPCAQIEVRRRAAVVPQLRAAVGAVRDDEFEEAGCRRTAAGAGRQEEDVQDHVSDVVQELLSCDSDTTPEYSSPLPEYPPSPQQPTHRDFEPRSPKRLIPGLFAAPFDQDDNEIVEETSQMQITGSDSSPRHSHTLHDRHSMSDSSGRLIADSTAHSSTPRAQGNVTGNANSHHVLVQWLDLFFMQNAAWEPVFPHFRQGLAYTAEIPLPLLPVGGGLPSLPPVATMNKYMTLFFDRTYPPFPVVDRLSFKFALSELRRRMDNSQPSPLQPALSASDYPLLACAYAMFSLSADEDSGGVSAEGTGYLEAVYFLYAHLVALPYVASIQALLLLTLVLRNRNKDVASWGSLGQAIRLAQSIGLHRQDSDNDGEGDLHARVWWTAYILERTMELETGRPSAIRDDECDQGLSGPNTEGGMFDYFNALIGLAKIKTRAIHLLYNNNNSKGGSRSKKNGPFKDLLSEMGYIDRALLDWADAFPESVRPGRDIFCGGDELPLATYVALQYHQMVIALHRPALMSAPGFLRDRINECCAGTPLRDRLHFSLCINAASARAILKATNDLSMYSAVPGQVSRSVTGDQILLAVLVLGIYVAKVPMSRLNRADLALVDTFGKQVEDEYLRAGHGPEFVKGITLFRSQLCDYIAGLQTDARTVQTSSPLPSSCHAEPEANADLLDGFDLDLTADVTNLEASWACFWNEDFEKLLAIPPSGAGSGASAGEPDMTSMANVTNMYLLGIPQSWP